MMEELWRFWSKLALAKTLRICQLESEARKAADKAAETELLLWNTEERLLVALAALTEISGSDPALDTWTDIQHFRDVAGSAMRRIKFLDGTRLPCSLG